MQTIHDVLLARFPILQMILHLVCNKILNFVLKELESYSDITINWFQNKHMKINSEKTQFRKVSSGFCMMGTLVVKKLNIIIIFLFYVLMEITNFLRCYDHERFNFPSKKKVNKSFLQISV